MYIYTCTDVHIIYYTSIILCFCTLLVWQCLPLGAGVDGSSVPTLANVLGVDVLKLDDWRVHTLNMVALYDQLSAARSWPLTDVKDSVLKFSDHNIMRCCYPPCSSRSSLCLLFWAGCSACFSSCSRSVCINSIYINPNNS